jgi:uncharacterized membrane protein YqiK
MLKDQVNDSLSIMRDTLRATVSSQISDGRQEIRNKTAEQIAAAVNAALEKVGMRVSNLEITELWSRSVQPKMTKGTN